MVAMAARTYHIGQIVRLKPAVSLNILVGYIRSQHAYLIMTANFSIESKVTMNRTSA
jgi:hypothetical protein